MSLAILIVDDSAVDRRLIAGIIHENTSHRVDVSCDGAEALGHIEVSRPDLVVADLVMPNLDGLELIRQVRDRHPQIPVILMTAYGNEETVSEALEAGAASYVPKAQQAERLVEIVHRVLRRAQADRCRRTACAQLRTTACSYVFDNDSAVIYSIVDQVQQTMSSMNLGDATERTRTCVALEEALLNSMYHGNLPISESELVEARHDYTGRTLATLVKLRRQDPKLRDRKIWLDVSLSLDLARFVVRDEGRGFCHEPTGHRLSDCFERGLNRGSMLMSSMMDEVSYSPTGNEVSLTKRPSCDRNAVARVFELDDWLSSGVTAVG